MAGVAGVGATSHPPSQKAKEDSASAGPAQGTAAVQLPEPHHEEKRHVPGAAQPHSKIFAQCHQKPRYLPSQAAVG